MLLVVLSAVGLLVAVVLVLVVALRPGVQAPPAAAAAAAAPAAAKPIGEAVPARVGGNSRLRVVVNPWAKVEVDGVVRALTPLDRPLALAPGEHVVRLLNPHYETEKRRVKLEAGSLVTIKVELKQRKAAASKGEQK